MNEDANSIIRAYLAAQTTLTDVVSSRIYHPRLPENCVLPALGFFTDGGSSTPYIPGLLSPSVQFDCWGITPIVARQVYRALYDVLQGIQNQTVAVGGINYLIYGAEEEGLAQDMQDADIPAYFRVMATFRLLIRAEDVS